MKTSLQRLLYAKKYYNAHIEQYRGYEKKRTPVRRKQLQYIMHNLKINGCAICGYDKCDAALDFHHVNPEDKKFCLTTGYLRLQDIKIIEELNKCILLCSNCHREIHAKQ